MNCRCKYIIAVIASCCKGFQQLLSLNEKNSSLECWERAPTPANLLGCECLSAVMLTVQALISWMIMNRHSSKTGFYLTKQWIQKSCFETCHWDSAIKRWNLRWTFPVTEPTDIIHMTVCPHSQLSPCVVSAGLQWFSLMMNLLVMLTQRLGQGFVKVLSTFSEVHLLSRAIVQVVTLCGPLHWTQTNIFQPSTTLRMNNWNSGRKSITCKVMTIKQTTELWVQHLL